MKESSLKRLFRFVLAHWPFLLLSTLAAFFFVIFNSASIWITATMINNILIDFNEMLVENQRLASLSELTCLLYTSPSPRDDVISRMPSSA